MSKLIHSSEEAKLQKMDDLAAEKETEARESIKREQEEAYQMSLMQDMEKQKKLQAEEGMATYCYSSCVNFAKIRKLYISVQFSFSVVRDSGDTL